MQATTNLTVISIEQTELETWFERDRAHVELRNTQTDTTILSVWDENVAELVEDGFLDPRDWHGSLYGYAAYLGALPWSQGGAV